MNRQNAQTARPPRPTQKQQPPQMQEEEQQSTNGPSDRVSLFPISVSIWMKYTPEGKPSYSVSLQRTYKDKAGNWVYSSNLFQGDLLIAAEALRTAYHRIEMMRQADRNGGGRMEE